MARFVIAQMWTYIQSVQKHFGRRHASRLVLSTVLFLLVPALMLPARARQNAPPAAPIQVTTRLVQLSVIVKDRHGHPVAGLKQEDFKIYDNGVAQGISDFEIEQTGTPATPSPIPPDIFTNVPERTAGVSPEVTVILLDGLNTKWTDQARSTDQIVKFLRQLQPGDRVGLYALGKQLILLHDFTGDAAALVQALSHYSGRANTEVAASQVDDPNNPPVWKDSVAQGTSDIPSQAVTAGIQDWLNRAVNLEAQFYMNQRVQMTKSAFLAIADHLRGVPGRKNLIWVSSAFPLLRGMDTAEQSGDFSFVTAYDSAIAECAEALSDANLAVYPVDARGLMPNPNDVIQTGPTTAGDYARARTPKLPAHVSDNFNAMDQMAQRTGGRAFYNTNDIQGSIRRVIDDSRLTYVLGFYPQGAAWDGKFHKIKVEVDQPGAQLEYRSGYAAIPEILPAPQMANQAAPAQPLKQAPEQELDEAALSPLDATGIGLVVRTRPDKTTAGTAQNISVQYWVNPHDITLAPIASNTRAQTAAPSSGPQSGPDANAASAGAQTNAEPRWAVRVTLVTVQFGPQGQSLNGTSHAFSFELNAAQQKQLLSAGLVFGAPLAIMSGAERLRVVVRDDPTGNLGSVSIPLDRVLPPPTH